MEASIFQDTDFVSRQIAPLISDLRTLYMLSRTSKRMLFLMKIEKNRVITPQGPIAIFVGKVPRNAGIFYAIDKTRKNLIAISHNPYSCRSIITYFFEGKRSIVRFEYKDARPSEYVICNQNRFTIWRYFLYLMHLGKNRKKTKQFLYHSKFPLFFEMVRADLKLIWLAIVFIGTILCLILLKLKN